MFIERLFTADISKEWIYWDWAKDLGFEIGKGITNVYTVGRGIEKSNLK